MIDKSFLDQEQDTQDSASMPTIRKDRLSEYMVEPDCPVDINIYEPMWVQGARTSFRVLPSVIDGTRILPGRREAAPQKYGNWLQTRHGVKKIGSINRVTFMHHYTEEEARNPRVSYPTWVLYTAIYNAAGTKEAKIIRTPFGDSETDDWKGLLTGGQNRSQALKPPELLSLMQGLIFRHGNKDYLAADGQPLGGQSDPRIWILLGEKCWQSVVRELDARADPEDESHLDRGFAYFKYPDPTDPNTGCFIHIYRREDGPPQLAPISRTSSFRLDGGQRQSQAKVGEGKQQGYGALVTETYDGTPNGCSASLPEDFVRDRFVPWSKGLRLVGSAEAAMLLATAFPASVIYHAFQNRPEWLPRDMRQGISVRTNDVKKNRELAVANSDEPDEDDPAVMAAKLGEHLATAHLQKEVPQTPVAPQAPAVPAAQPTRPTMNLSGSRKSDPVSQEGAGEGIDPNAQALLRAQASTKQKLEDAIKRVKQSAQENGAAS